MHAHAEKRTHAHMRQMQKRAERKQLPVFTTIFCGHPRKLLLYI